MDRKRSIFFTLLILGLLWWCYELTDMYAWGLHQVLNGILVVAGMLGIGLAFYVIMRYGAETEQDNRRRTQRPYVYTGGGLWQR
jgi:hypothetical protein